MSVYIGAWSPERKSPTGRGTLKGIPSFSAIQVFPGKLTEADKDMVRRLGFRLGPVSNRLPPPVPDEEAI